MSGDSCYAVSNDINDLYPNEIVQDLPDICLSIAWSFESAPKIARERGYSLVLISGEERQSRAELSRAEQSRAELSIAERSEAIQLAARAQALQIAEHATNPRSGSNGLRAGCGKNTYGYTYVVRFRGRWAQVGWARIDRAMKANGQSNFRERRRRDGGASEIKVDARTTADRAARDKRKRREINTRTNEPAKRG
ncbi:hypothetical protein K0M31_007563 [Melipona bicolor]|uniref:Uncharacterized protein n=1 Tax=Melipona bicolor TaxID=60889 RepID=A0AA40KVS2_9HYME|nr:hypothetical protein K0M31_007563 [Melipona bicolor]